MAPIPMLDAVEFSKIPALNFVVPVVAADPTGTLIFGTVQHLSDNELTVAFATALTGRVNCI
jgi:hypothetical protein